MPGSNVDKEPRDLDWLDQSFRYVSESNVWSLKANSGEFTYSDGDANEDYLLSVMRSASDSSVMSNELMAAMKDWPSTYHLHHQRCNLFRPIVQQLNGPILEIGAGCGVLTRFLGEQGDTVFALEGSARRASIIGARCKDLPNVSVLNANFQDFHTGQKFQTITLIGVLEYARLYFADGTENDPVDQMLKRVAGMLAPDGVLIVAIENQMGLKYFAGYPEDHLGIPMAGIEGHYTDKSVVTFGRQELSERLSKAGLMQQRFAYPVPDYKFPEAVLFEKAMTGEHAHKFSAMIGGAIKSDRQKPNRLNFRMSKAIHEIMKNGMGADMANSFLVTSSNSAKAFSESDESCAVYYGNGDRKKAYLKEIRVTERGGKLNVSRRPLVDISPPKNTEIVHVLEDEPFAEGGLWLEELQNLLLKDNWTVESLAGWAHTWIDGLKAKAGLEANATLSVTTEIDGALLDAIPKNLIVDRSGKCHFMDLEWKATKPLEMGYVIVRGLSDAFTGIEFANKSNMSTDVTSLVGDVCAVLDFPMSRSEIEQHLEREYAFQQQISNKPGTNKKLQFIQTQMSYRSLNKLERRMRNLRRLAHKIRHPIRTRS